MFGKQGYDTEKTFDCKWELDSLASFLQISSEYYNATGDIGPFEKYKWVDTVEVILDAAEAMRTATYTKDGHIAPSGYTMTGQTDRATETTSNNGLGNPVIWTGMVRSTFRPSDDATIFQFFIPGNMMFARYLEAAAAILDTLNTARSIDLALRMRTMAAEIRAGITKYGIVSHPLFGAMFAFEVDGYGSQVWSPTTLQLKANHTDISQEPYGRCQSAQSSLRPYVRLCQSPRRSLPKHKTFCVK